MNDKPNSRNARLRETKDSFKKRNIKLIKYSFEKSTVHGFNHLVAKGRHYAERWLWVIIILATVYPCVYLALTAWSHYNENPTVISIERDYMNWNDRMPSFTICQTELRLPNATVDQFDNRRDYNISEIPYQILDEVKEKLGDYDEDEVEEFLEIVLLGNFSSYSKLEKFKKFDVFPTERYLQWAGLTRVRVTMNGEEMIPVLTEFGLCNMFNNVVGAYNTQQYWRNKSTRFQNIDQRPLFLKPQQKEFYRNELDFSYKFFTHSSNDFIDLETKYSQFGHDTYVALDVYLETIWTSNEVQKLGIQQRHCRYPNESNLAHSPVYSYRHCRMECRIQMCLRHCGCTPFYYTKIGNEQTCNIQGLLCLSKFAGSIINLTDSNGVNNCPCIQNCDFTHTTCLIQAEQDWFFKTLIQVDLQNTQKFRYKRSLIYTKSDLVVQIGGIAGLCYGMGILSLVDFVYCITLRFFWGGVMKKI